jgi:pyrroline-5-carboxylate reductase
MREEGIAIGLDDSIIDELIRGTFEGAAAMLASSKLHPAELKQAVTTPGGTTEAGLAAMDQAGLVKAARAGVHAAYMRGRSIADA